MKTFIVLLLAAASLVCFAEPAFSTEQPNMEAALGYLQQVAKPTPPQSSKAKLKLLKSAQETLEKVPSIYKGQKAAARKLVELAIQQLDSGKEAAALESTEKAIAQIQDGIAYLDNLEKAGPNSGKSGPGKPKDYFGEKE